MTSNHQRVDKTTPQTAQPSGLAGFQMWTGDKIMDMMYFEVYKAILVELITRVCKVDAFLLCILRSDIIKGGI